MTSGQRPESTFENLALQSGDEPLIKLFRSQSLPEAARVLRDRGWGDQTIFDTLARWHAAWTELQSNNAWWSMTMAERRRKSKKAAAACNRLRRAISELGVDVDLCKRLKPPRAVNQLLQFLLPPGEHFVSDEEGIIEAPLSSLESWLEDLPNQLVAPGRQDKHRARRALTLGIALDLKLDGKDDWVVLTKNIVDVVTQSDTDERHIREMVQNQIEVLEANGLAEHLTEGLRELFSGKTGERSASDITPFLSLTSE